MTTQVQQRAEIERVRRRRKNDPAGVRARILDAAFELFQAQGYNATSVHDIAASAGVTAGALHHHFPTKKLIALHVIAERVGTALEETWLEPIRNSANARAGILKVFDSLAAELDAQGSVRGCPVNNLALELAFADPDYQNALRSLFDQWRETLAKKLGGRDSIARAALVIAAYSGAMAMAKVEQCGEPLRLCAKELKRIL
jgi:TetR/AcrR family transcriptional regulator, transcriptional repressor for nem operon